MSENIPRVAPPDSERVSIKGSASAGIFKASRGSCKIEAKASMAPDARSIDTAAIIATR